MTLSISAVATRGAFHLEAELAVEAGETVAVLGPNGAGKSTLLRAVAGLQPLEGGRIVLDGVVLDDPSTDRFVPPHERPLGVVFQDLALFPHLDVTENVAFGMRARGATRHDARAEANRWMTRLGLEAFRDTRPRQLSGGQQQKVALARALAGDPRVLLLDEPLSSLDVSARAETRRMLHDHLDGFAGMRLVVTHEPLDARSLASRIVVLEGGRVTHDATFAELVARPRSRYVAELVGLNVIEGHGDGTSLTTSRGAVVAGAEPTTGPSLAIIAPTAIAIHRNQPSGSPRNVWPVVVADIDVQGERVRVRVAGPVDLIAEVTAAANAELTLRPGDLVWASVKAVEVRFSPS
jgi:molybdate transport system ATP-binding protein